MPHSNTHSPSRSAARVTSIRYAVSNTSGKAAASSNESPSGNRIHVGRRHGDQLGVRPVTVLADDVDGAVGRLYAGVDHHALSRLEAVHAAAERFDDAGAVGAEDARLRHRREALADPDVQMVQG